MSDEQTESRLRRLLKPAPWVAEMRQHYLRNRTVRIGDVARWLHEQSRPLATWSSRPSSTTSELLRELATKKSVGNGSVLPPPSVRSTEQEFLELVSEWKTAVHFSSSLTEMLRHDAYRRIVAMGTRVVGLLIHEMATDPDHWGPALTEITGAQPIQESDAGNLRKIAEAWVRWGREHGF